MTGELTATGGIVPPARVSWAVLLVSTSGEPAPRLDSAWTNLQDAELRLEELWRLFAVWRVPLSAILGRIPDEHELPIVWPIVRGAEG